jgi:H+/Cl- antiporter ClcA
MAGSSEAAGGRPMADGAPEAAGGRPMADGAPAASARPRPRTLLALLAVAAVVGLVVSLASWGFLEGIHQIQQGVFVDLPRDLGYDDGAPLWWPVPVLGVAGLITAFAIERLPGTGGHSPAGGLATGVTQPVELPGVLLAAVATIGLGVVLGPEAPLIALGSGLGILAVRLVKRDAPDRLVAVVAAAGSFAAVSFIFGSPLVGAVILIEAAGLDRERLLVVVPVGLLAAGIGSLVSIGMGSWTGLSSSDYALSPLTLPDFARPDVTDFLWTVPLAVAVAAGCFAIFAGAQALQPVLERRRFVLLPAAGLVVAGLAIAFSQVTDEGAQQVLFSGQDQLPDLVAGAGTWSVSALALVLGFKGVAWSVSLAGFRGGPTFPGLFLGAAAGILASHLPGLELTPAIAIGMGAAVVAVLRLPLSAVLLALVLTNGAGRGVEPLVIVGVVAALVTTLGLSRRATAAGAQDGTATPQPQAEVAGKA